ncbi:MAG: polysaccharide biosynthesis protein [Chloroflexi bacterium]|nr:polysaccharide biosynthesis protein [Chloroflexota bacterium]
MSTGNASLASAARGSLILMLATLVELMVNYGFNIGLGWLLSPGEYGIYGIAMAILNILTIFLMRGLPQSTAKLLSEPGCAEERRSLIFRSSLLGNVLTGVLASGIFFILYRVFMPGDKTYFTVVLIIISTILVIALRSVYFGALVGSFRFKARGTIEATSEMIKLFVGVGLVYLGYGVSGAFGGYFVGAMLALILASVFLRDVKFWKGGWKLERRVFSYGFPMLLVALAMLAMQNADILGVKLLTEGDIANESAGYYQAVLVIGKVPFYVTGAVTMVLLPFVSRFEKKGAGAYAGQMLKYTALFVLPLSVIIAIQPAELIRLLYPDTYLQSAPALTILAIGTGLFCFSNIIGVVLQGIGRPWVPALVLAISAIVQIGLLPVLIPRFGITGAAGAAAIAAFVSLSILGYVYQQMFGLKVKVRGVLSMLVAMGVLGALLWLLPAPGRLVTLANIVGAGLIYVLVLMILKLFKEQDADILLGALPDNVFLKSCGLLMRRMVVRLNNVL